MEILLTEKVAILPPDIGRLLDESKPLPPGLRFFEEAFTFGKLLWVLFLGLIMIPIGLVLIVLGLSLFNENRHVYSTHAHAGDTGLWELLAGIGFLIGTWILLGSLWGRWRLMRTQQGGRATRYGVFLLPETLVLRSFQDILVMPRPLLKALENHRLLYQLNGQDKSTPLPNRLVGHDRQALDAAVVAWMAGR